MSRIIACVLCVGTAMAAFISVATAEGIWGCYAANDVGPCDRLAVKTCWARGMTWEGPTLDLARSVAVELCEKNARAGNGSGQCKIVSCSKNVLTRQEALTLGQDNDGR
jgi:hypothetical protein